MDDLLHRLRHDMVELSSQGDNFTQQIWLMYGQFEQVVDRFHWPPVVTEKTGSIHHRSLRHSPIRHRRRHRRPRNNNNRTKMMMNVVGSSTSFASDSESDSEMMDMPKMMGAGGSRQGVYSSRSASSSKGLNPLLDTISVIGDLCDSDDAIDGPSSATFYAGSNSVDSGYKSSCPTPDCLILAQDANNYISARTAAPPPPPVLPKSRRTLPAVPPSAVDGLNRCPTGGGAPLDLDHLTSLRRTLLTAIERYDTRTKELIDRELSSGMKSLDCDQIHPADADATDDDETGNERGLLCQTELKETQPEQDGATRFSRVAHCMLEIIEDLQRQQQQQQQSTSESCNVVAIDEPVGVPVVPPKPARISISMASTTTATPAPATPPRVARRGRRKLPTPTIPPSPPSSVDSAELTGADYHLYEEIIYDLGSSKTSIHSTIDSSNVDQIKKTIVSCPPPLPARPSRPLNVTTTMGSCLSNSVKPWLNVIKPLRRDRNNQLIRNNNNNNTTNSSCSSLSSCCSSSQSSHWTSVANNKLNGHTDIARSNVYTFGNAQSHPPVIKPQAIHPTVNPSSLHHQHHHRSSAHLHEDEYGFRAVSHMV